MRRVSGRMCHAQSSPRQTDGTATFVFGYTCLKDSVLFVHFGFWCTLAGDLLDLGISQRLWAQQLRERFIYILVLVSRYGF